MYDTDHPVYAELQKIGKEITQKVKPKAVVVFSAHWQGERDVIEINTFENTELIYEYVSFSIPNKLTPDETPTVSTASQPTTTKRPTQIKAPQRSPKK